MLRKIRDFLIIAAVTFVLLEIGLRIYNPIYVPLRADQIELPVNRVFKMVNVNNKKVDRELVNTYNAIGLRGPNYPDKPDEYVKIITVGGSTTACVTLTDGRTWPDVLGRTLVDPPGRKVWLNNAGIDGHSTFGHQILLQSHLKKFKPDYIVYLIGINDRSREDLNEYDIRLIKAGLSLRNKIVASSELLSTAQVLNRTRKAYDEGLNHHFDHDLSKFRRLDETPAQREAYLAKQRERFLAPYRSRVERLIATTRELGAEPVLVTQTGLMGNAVDPSTGIEMGTLEYWEMGRSGTLEWAALELYNDVLRELADRHKLILIDAARSMPKDSKYYFDWIHYSNSGAELMGQIVAKGLQPYLSAKAAAAR